MTTQESVPVPHVRIGIDVGGTYTDFVAVSPRLGAVHHKQPSTPDDPARAVLEGFTAMIGRWGLDVAEIESVSHGTTIGLNAIIQRRGAELCLVISRGHRDVLSMTQRLPSKYLLRQDPSPGLVPRERVIEIDARLDARGEVVDDPSDDEIARVAAEISARGTGAVALTVLHSYRNPDFEQRVADRLSAALAGLPVTASAATWPEIREYDRTSVVTLNAYITPLMDTYLGELQRHLTSLGITAPIYITASNGGSLGIEAARERPIDTILSGPAAGVTATLSLAAHEGLDKVISFDMGGTSSDIAVAVAGEAEFANRTEVGGLPLILPVIQVNGIGAGGGSIAGVTSEGSMHVGPESAGSVPGPVSYGRGGTAFTIMDAYVASGFIDPQGILGSTDGIDREALVASAKSVSDLLSQHGVTDIAEVASAVLEVATVNMASETRKILAQRGYPASEFVLVAFGGGGPTHAAMLAEEVGISRIVVPIAAGTYCALGAVGANLRRDFLHGVGDEVSTATAATVTHHFEELFRAGQEWVAAQGPRVRSVEVHGVLNMRYRGQAFDLEVPVEEQDLPLGPEWMAEAFHRTHAEMFGHRDSGSDMTVLSAKVVAIGVVDPISWDAPATDSAPAVEPRSREIHLAGSTYDARLIGPDEITDTFSAEGPAVIELPLTTVVVPPGWTVARNTSHSLTLTRSATPKETGR